MLGSQFIVAGLDAGESAIIACFEDIPMSISRAAKPVSEDGRAAVEPIMQRTRLDAANVRSALDRPVLLGYLVATERDGGTAYEPPGRQRE